MTVMAKPRPEPVKDPVIEKLDLVLAKLEDDAAMRKYQTTGDMAIPMTSREVAAILGGGHRTVDNYVCRRLLRRRWTCHAGFHPDDVRAFLKSQGK
jgi:hypothetical protein